METDYEMVTHLFYGHSFVVITVFDLKKSKAGLLLSTPLEYEALHSQGRDAIFEVWEDMDRPTEEELIITRPDNRKWEVFANIAVDVRLNKQLWILSIRMTRFFGETDSVSEGSVSGGSFSEELFSEGSVSGGSVSGRSFSEGSFEE
jgi:hypothetical protein